MELLNRMESFNCSSNGFSKGAIEANVSIKNRCRLSVMARRMHVLHTNDPNITNNITA
jgi:hypothetical protein